MPAEKSEALRGRKGKKRSSRQKAEVKHGL